MPREERPKVRRDYPDRLGSGPRQHPARKGLSRPTRRPGRDNRGVGISRVTPNSGLLDDFLLTPAAVDTCRDLLEVIEDRAERRATLIASQMPVEKWLAAMADPTLGEAILDRLCQASHRIALKGPSMRRRQADPPAGEQ